MKKAYTTPEFTIYKCTLNAALLAGSGIDQGDQGDDGGAMSKGTSGSGMWEYMNEDEE